MAKNNTADIPLEPGTIFRFNPAACLWWDTGRYDYLKQPYFIIENGYLHYESDGWWLHVQGMKAPGGDAILCIPGHGSGWGFAPEAYVIDHFLTAVRRAKLCQKKTLHSKPVT